MLSASLWLAQIRASLTESVNFCTIWRMNSDFYLYLLIFSNTLSNRLSISFKYYFFIHYLFFFNNYTSSNIFLFNTLIIIIEKKIWRMNSSPSDLMSYYSWAKIFFGYRESIGVTFFVSFSIIENILLLHRPLEML